MAKQDIDVELFYDGTWHNLVDSSEVLADTPIRIARGQGDESQAPRPSSIALRLKNHADKFRTSNPVSPLYGKAGVNTPLRVSVGGSVRGYGEVSSWACDQTTDFRASPLRGNAWADVEAGGVLARINQWTHNVKSPLRLATENIGGLNGYWPLEDPAGTVNATSVVTGRQNQFLRGHSFGSQNSPPGGGTAVDVGANPVGGFICTPGDSNSTAGWQANKVIFLNKLTGGGVSDPLMFLQLSNDWVVSLLLDGDTGVVTLHAANLAGTEQLGATVATSGYAWTGRWIMVHLQATYSGGTTTVGAYWRAVGEDDWSTFSDTWSGATSQIYGMGTVLPEGSSYGHVAMTAGTADPLTSEARFEAFEGHDGERASYRFGRLCDENGVPYYVSDSFDESAEMGPQGPDRLPDLFKIIASTEDALIFDYRSEARLFMLSRGDRFNQDPALTLDATGTDHGMPSLPREVTDDLPVHNIVTARQVTGGDYTAEDSTSAMGSQDPPNGRGEYRQTVDVNVGDPAADLPQQAHWYLNRGTVNRPRFPSVTVDLTTLSPTKIAEVEAVDVGSVIEIVNYREYTIRLYVLGYTETIGTHTRSITFTCAPDDVFNAGQLDGARLQARSTTLNASITSTATTLVLKSTADGERWRPGASTAHVLIGGEEIALGTVGSRTGSGPWTWTVTGCTRSVNGIVKAQSASAPVKVIDAIRLAL